MRIQFLISFILFTLNTFSQQNNVEIKGWVKSKVSDTLLEGAQVRIMNSKDSTLVNYTFTNNNGKFIININESVPSIQVFIDYIGYHQYAKEILITHSEILLDTISLKKNNYLLNAVVIQSSPSPISYNSDTLTFKADYFRNERIEGTVELLESLPGVVLTSEGIMLVNGLPVDKVTINGKPFFKDQFIPALEDFPEEILESIQITSTKSKSEAFTNDEGSNDSKTINLVIKDRDKNKLMGNISVGCGTNKRFELKLGVNSFGEKIQFNILSGTNNINSSGSSIKKITQNKRPKTVQKLGLTLSSELSKKVTFSGNYFVTRTKRNNEMERIRDNSFPNSNYFSTKHRISENSGTIHLINLRIDYEVNPTLLISVIPSFIITKNETEAYYSNTSFQEINSIINGSNGFTETDATGFNIENKLSITKKTGKIGNILKFELSNIIDLQQDKNITSSDIYFQDDTELVNLKQNQTRKLDQNNSTIQLGTSYKFNVKEQRIFLLIGATYFKEEIKENYSTYNNNEFFVLSTALSTDFKTTENDITPYIKMTYKKKNWSSDITLSHFVKTLNYIDLLRPETNFERHFNATFLTSQIKYKINKKASVNGTYSLNKSLPAFSELQPFENIITPLNTISGNPDLNLQENHQFNFKYQSFKNKQQMFVYLNIDLKNNQIIPKSVIDENLIKHTTFENVKGGYSIYGSMSYQKKVALDSNLAMNLKLSLTPGVSRNISFNNGYIYKNYIFSIAPEVSTKIVFENKNYLKIGYQTSVRNTSYGLSTQFNRYLFKHEVQVSSDIRIIKKLIWNSQFLLVKRSNTGLISQKTNLLWNSTIDYTFNKRKTKLSLMVFDILNQNTGINQTATTDYTENSEQTVLKRYVMIKLSWKIKH